MKCWQWCNSVLIQQHQKCISLMWVWNMNIWGLLRRDKRSRLEPGRFGFEKQKRSCLEKWIMPSPVQHSYATCVIEPTSIYNKLNECCMFSISYRPCVSCVDMARKEVMSCYIWVWAGLSAAYHRNTTCVILTSHVFFGLFGVQMAASIHWPHGNLHFHRCHPGLCWTLLCLSE